MIITKQDGAREEFNSFKLRRSLLRAGASEKASGDVVSQIERGLKEGMGTGEIYKRAFSLLKKMKGTTASRYSMKRAVLALGPSGYPFEDFVAEIFKRKGFKTSVGKIIKGVCVEHEVDVIAKKGNGDCIEAELKFHNKLGLKSDLKVALYVHARFEDIRKAEKKRGKTDCIKKGWLITNTKFTSNAIKYGKCVGLNMVSWNYPSRGNLQDMIEETGVQPITALTTISKKNAANLMRNKVVLCRNVRGNEHIMRSVGIKGAKIQQIIEESNALCNINN